MKFKLGDRVSVTWDVYNLVNKPGTIIAFRQSGCPGIMFNEPVFGGHTCNIGAVQRLSVKPYTNTCLWVPEGNIRPIENIHIEIDSDNVKNTTLVMTVGDKVVESSARCAPEDEFDLATGISICIERALKKLEDANKLMNGRYVYIADGQPGLTKGKIYVFTDGTYIDDDGDVRPVQISNGRPPFAKDENYAKQFVKVVE